MRTGRLDGLLQQIVNASDNLREVSATGEFSSSDGRLQAQVTMAESGETVWADVLMSAAGGGATIRLPTKGDAGLVALVDGDLRRAYVLGWFANGEAPDVAEKTLHLQPPGGESVTIKTTTTGEVLIESAAKVIIKCADIRQGSAAASDPVALQSKIQQKDALRDSAFASHTHAYVIPLIPLFAAPTAPPVPSVLGTIPTGAIKVKGE